MIHAMKQALQLLEDAQTIEPRKWEVWVHGAIRTVSATHDGALCPVIAAYRTFIGDDEYTVDDAMNAGRDLGIPGVVAADIIDASDIWECIPKDVRAELMRIYNLTNEASNG